MGGSIGSGSRLRGRGRGLGAWMRLLGGGLGGVSGDEGKRWCGVGLKG